MRHHRNTSYGSQDYGFDGVGSSLRAAGGTAIINKISACVVGTFVAAAILFGASDRVEAGGVLAIAFDDATFTGLPEVIDNPHWPLNPDGIAGYGRAFTYQAEKDDGCALEVARVVGLKTLVGGDAPYDNFVTLEVEDVAYADEDCSGDPGQSVKEEHTFDWYRQDDDGNIWYLGELSRVYDEEGCFDDNLPSEADRLVHPDCYEGSWEAGKGPEDGLIAEAGIVVPDDYPMGFAGDPLAPGTAYLQELAEEAMDVAKVLKTDTKVKFKVDGATTVFRNCRVTKEYSSLSPGSVEHKNYCPDDGGLVLIEEFQGEKTVLVVLIDVWPPLP